MVGSLNKSYPFNDNLKFNLQLIFGISLGVFLFLIFFLPLNPPILDFNKKILILAGFGGIIFIILFLLQIVIPQLIPQIFFKNWNVKKQIISYFSFLIINSVAFSFYAQYVGKIEISFHLAVNIILISMAPIIVLIIINQYDFLKKRIQDLINQNNLPDVTENGAGIDFESENKSDNFYLFPEQIILIKAADNYVEIIYKQNDTVSRRLVRNSMKKTEQLVLNHPSLIRCHRSFIVNKNCIQRVKKSSEGLKLILFDYPQEINVSRQYILKVKEALRKE